MRDIEDADPLADGGVLGDHSPAGVFEGHRPAAEFTHLCSEREVASVEGRLDQGVRGICHARTLPLPPRTRAC